MRQLPTTTGTMRGTYLTRPWPRTHSVPHGRSVHRAQRFPSQELLLHHGDGTQQQYQQRYQKQKQHIKNNNSIIKNNNNINNRKKRLSLGSGADSQGSHTSISKLMCRGRPSRCFSARSMTPPMPYLCSGHHKCQSIGERGWSQQPHPTCLHAAWSTPEFHAHR